MVKVISAVSRGGAKWKAIQTALDGSGSNDYLGDIPREDHNGQIDNYNELEGPYIQKHRDNLYMAVCKTAQTVKIYKAFRGAIRVNISADPAATLPLAGEVMTQGAVTATLIEDYKAGDLYINVIGESGGTFTAGAVTFTTGDPATITTREDHGGEWGMVDESDQILMNAGTSGVGTATCSGLGYGIRDGKPTLGMIYIDNSLNIRSFIMDPNTLAWIDTDTLEQQLSQYVYRDCGSVMNQNTLVWIFQGHNSLSRTWAAELNFATGALAYGQAPAQSNGVRGSSPVLWNGQVFYALCQSSGIFWLYNVAGGAFVLSCVVNLDNDLTSVSPMSCFVGPDDNALYIMAMSNQNSLRMYRFYMNTTGDVIKCSPPDNGTELNQDIGEVMIPSALRLSQSPGANTRVFLDAAADPLIAKLHLWYAFDQGAVARRELSYTPHAIIDSGNKPTFSGTTGSSNDAVFQNDISSELAAGDWLTIWEGALKGASYRVVAVTNGGLDVELENLTGTISPPSTALNQPDLIAGTFEVRKAQLMATESGDVGGLAGAALPHGRTGGSSTYDDGEISGEYQSQDEVAGGVELTFDIFDPDSASAGSDLEARGYYMKEDGTQGQMTLRSVGQGVRNGNVNEDLSSGNGKTFVWDAEDNGIANGMVTQKSVRIERV